MSHTWHNIVRIQGASVGSESNWSIPHELAVSGASHSQDHLLVATQSDTLPKAHHVRARRSGHCVPDERLDYLQILPGIRPENGAERASTTCHRRGEERRVRALHGLVGRARELELLGELQRGAILQSPIHSVRSDSD